MADPRSIHEFTTGQVEATTLLLGDFVDLDAQSGYTTYKASVSDIGEVILEDIEYTQDLTTVDKTIIGAINENKSVIGYSYDAYDATTAYSTGDLCIYNNVLYKAKQATTGNLPTNTTYWEQTSIADEISELKSDIDPNALRTSLILGNFAVYSAERILNNASKDIPLTQNLFVLFIKSYADARTFGVYLISYHGSVATSNYISKVSEGTALLPTLSIVDGNKLRITTNGVDVYYSMLRLN